MILLGSSWGGFLKKLIASGLPVIRLESETARPDRERSGLIASNESTRVATSGAGAL
jgi:hypothetical protein